MIFDIVLAALVLAVAVWTVLARDTFAAIVGFVAYGLLLGLVWVRLAAVDAALTEAAIGGGVTGALLLGAAARLRPTETTAEAPDRFRVWAVGALCMAVAASLMVLVLFVASPAPSLAPLAVAPLQNLGIGNAVTGVLLAYRAIDTLLEKIVLLVAVIGVWSLAPDRVWGGVPEAPPAATDGPLRLLGRILPPFGCVVGIYTLWEGAKAPGGAFQGGTILAAMWLLVLLAGLRRMPETGRPSLRLLLLAGPGLFVAVGLLGIAAAGAFLAYPEGVEKSVIVAVEAALTLSIAVILGLLAAGPPATPPAGR